MGGVLIAWCLALVAMILRDGRSAIWYNTEHDKTAASFGRFSARDARTFLDVQREYASMGGRVFALQIHTNTLHAYDAYNGRLLWKKPAESGLPGSWRKVSPIVTNSTGKSVSTIAIGPCRKSADE